LFREFAVTLSVAIGVSLAVSLTTTPMLCSRFLRSEKNRARGRVYRAFEGGFDGLRRGYEGALQGVLRHQPLVLFTTRATACRSVFLYVQVPKGFFPQQDTGRLIGSLQASQDASFDVVRSKLATCVDIIQHDPAVDHLIGFGGGRGGPRNSARLFAQLKPIGERKTSAD